MSAFLPSAFTTVLPLGNNNFASKLTYILPFFCSTVNPLSLNPRRALDILSFNARTAASFSAIMFSSSTTLASRIFNSFSKSSRRFSLAFNCFSNSLSRSSFANSSSCVSRKIFTSFLFSAEPCVFASFSRSNKS